MPKSNIKQATLIPSAQPVLNPRGTAPGWWVERDGHIIVAMPGPPHEMQYMWSNEIVSRLKQKKQTEIIASRTLKTFGLGEARVGELVSPFFASSNPTLGIYAKNDGIHLRITAKASSKVEAEVLLAKRDLEIRNILDKYIWGTDLETLENVVGEILINSNLTIATIESNCGELIANTITGVKKSNYFYKGGFIINPCNLELIGFDTSLILKYGVKSLNIAEGMATKAREKFGADIGIGITGIMPLDDINNVGGIMHIAIDYSNAIHSFSRNFTGHHNIMKRRAIIAALFELRKILLGRD